MYRITQVEPQKRNLSRFNVFLDGKFAFGVDEDLVVERRLVVGKEIFQEDLEKILFEVEVGKLMERMYGFVSIRQRSEKEIRDYLKNLSFKRKIKDQDELSEVIIESLINKLKQKGLINDEQFAKDWIAARRKSKNKGANALKAELYQKGISRGVISEVMSEEFRVQRGAQTETELARQALEKKLKSWRSLSEMEFKKKAYGFLTRRGFEYPVIEDVLEKLLKKE